MIENIWILLFIMISFHLLNHQKLFCVIKTHIMKLSNRLRLQINSRMTSVVNRNCTSTTGERSIGWTVTAGTEPDNVVPNFRKMIHIRIPGFSKAFQFPSRLSLVSRLRCKILVAITSSASSVLRFLCHLLKRCRVLVFEASRSK